jgi:two-component system alkaline phosphatase synthesis response regulator PhoP
MIGARMILEGKWSGKGVFNVEEFNPDPFMDGLRLNLGWTACPGTKKVDPGIDLEMDLRIEEDKNGTLIIMPPVDFDSGVREGRAYGYLFAWWLTHKRGEVSSTSKPRVMKWSVRGNGRKALDLIGGQHFDLLLLDVMLPEVDGFSITEQVRLSNHEVPILILTAKDMAQDRIAGLKRGADDYLTKPFNLEELLLRVSNLLRRSQRVKGEAIDQFEFGNNFVNFETYEGTTFRGEAITLTKKEAMLLKLLVERKNEVVSRNQILQAVWGYDVFPSTRTIDNFILAFRKYFEEDPKQPRFFHSIRGVGYKFTMSE